MLTGSSAFGASYYASLTTKVATDCSGMGKVYASKTKTEDVSQYTDDANGSTIKSDDAGGAGKTVTLYAFAKANEGYEFKGWSTSASGATSYESTDNPWEASLAASKTDNGTESYTYYAYFATKALPSFSVTFLAPQNGSYTVDGTSVGSGGLVNGPYTEVYKPKLVATAADGYAFNGWYTTTDGGATKTPLSQEVDYTASFTAATTVGADFVKSVTVRTAEELLYSLEHDTLMEIPAGVTIAIESGTLASGKTLIINGDLFLGGTFTNNGTIKGGGRISTYTKQVTQTGASGDTPFETTCVVASYNKKYYKTEISVLNGKISGKAPTCNIQNAAKVVRNGVTIAQCVWPSNVTPAILSCTFSTTKAVNTITGFNDPCYYANTTSDIGKALLAAKKSPSSVMLLLLSNVTVDNDVVLSDKGLYVVQGSYNKFDGNYGTIDLANNTWTVSPKNFNSYSHTFLNGKLAITTLMYGGTLNCFNLGLASSKSYLLTNQIKVNGGANINIYDCTTDKVFGSYNGSGTPTGSINFYSSGETVYTVNNFASNTSAYHIYGGRWKTKPDDSFIASAMKSEYAFYQTSETDTSYSLKKNSDMSVVQLDDGTKYTSLADAFAALPSMTASSVTMTMLKDAKLASAVTVPDGKTVEMELKGMCITASNGFVVNNGTFRIGDGTGKYDTSGGRVIVEAGYLLQNAGEAEITYGYYTGNINLTGGKLITHHGYFTGAVTADDKSYADLRGGYFVQSVAELLADGYYQRGGSNKDNGYVGPFPKPAVSREWITSNGGYWRYSMKTLPQSDLELYNNTSSKKDDYSLENWKRRAEVMSMVTPYLNYVVDIGVSFDRNIAKDTATARVTDPVGITQNLDQDVAANELYRVFSPYFVKQGTSQKKYSAFLANGTWPEDFQTTTFGITTSTEGNYGTTADLRIDLCSGSDTSLTSVYALMSEYVALSAGKTNQAMIQPASGAATFYATIAKAVEACPEGGTIKLCNNIDTTDTITVSKAVTIDTNGMEFNGTFAPGKTYEMEKKETVLDVEKAIGKKHFTYTFTRAFIPVARIGETDYPTLAAAVGAVTEDETILLLADCAENVKTDKQVAFTINADGNAFTGSVDGEGAASEFTLVDKGEGIYSYESVKFVPPEGEIKVGGKVVAVTKEWVANNVTGANPPSADEVNAALGATQANGLTGFQNYIVGVESTKMHPLAPATGQAEKGKVVITTFANLNPPKIKTGFIVSYHLMKAKYDATKGEIGSFELAQELTTPEFPIAIDTLDPETYWKIETKIDSLND